MYVVEGTYQVGLWTRTVQRAWNQHTPNNIEIRICRISDWNCVLGILQQSSYELSLKLIFMTTHYWQNGERESCRTWTRVPAFGLRAGFVEWTVVVRDTFGTTSRVGIPKEFWETSAGSSSIPFFTSSVESTWGWVAWAWWLDSDRRRRRKRTALKWITNVARFADAGNKMKICGNTDHVFIWFFPYIYIY